jgi:glycosyltransferase involved in cell wall biosynthesis
MPHGMLDPYFQRAPSRKFKAFRNWVYWKLLEHKTVSQADGILFTCETELLMARETFQPYKPQREINVGYGIEIPPVFTPSMQLAFKHTCPTLGDAPYLLFLSRINYKKGVDLLIKAYAKLLSEYPTDSSIPKLVIAGPGVEAQYGQQMKYLIAKTPGIASSIFFAGMLTGDAKWGALYGCDAFILPSHQENFGIAVAEALACGKPVLISNQVNIWREIEAGGGGLIADDTLAGTEQLLKQWLRLTPTDQNEMGQNAKATFAQHFTVERAAQQFKEAIS